MRATAAAIVILAGAVLGAAATLATTARDGMPAPAGFGGGALILLGLVLLLFGWDRADRRPAPTLPDEPPALRS